MIIFAIIFIVVAIWYFYESYNRYPSNNFPTTKAQKDYEVRMMLKQSFIDRIRNHEMIESVRDTELEALVTLNVISNLYESAIKNFKENKHTLQFTDAEISTMVKSVTNEVMDIFVSNSKQFHIK